MVSSIFKIITFLGLTIMALVLIGTRDVISTISEKKHTLVPIHIEKIAAPKLEQKDNQIPDTTSSSTLEPTNTSEDPSPANTPQAQEPVAVPKTATTATYVSMQEGQSDTDESYHPQVSPCKVTMGYKIGRFDANFGISKAKFIQEIDAAASLWGDQLGKKLFVYDENGPLTINLIYDERQASTENINNLALEIQNSKDAAEVLKNAYEQEKMIYEGDGEQLTKDSEAFNARYKLYADKVTLYNSQGGAPAEVYNEMTKELATLKQMSQDLTARKETLILFMNSINAKVQKYNEFVSYINSLIEKSNALGAKKFTEGRFSPSSNTIDIYQYNDLIKLRRVVAHELGHVLGINHTKSMYSIMYAVNSATSTELGDDDIQALMDVCPK